MTDPIREDVTREDPVCEDVTREDAISEEIARPAEDTPTNSEETADPPASSPAPPTAPSPELIETAPSEARVPTAGASEARETPPGAAGPILVTARGRILPTTPRKMQRLYRKLPAALWVMIISLGLFLYNAALSYAALYSSPANHLRSIEFMSVALFVCLAWTGLFLLSQALRRQKDNVPPPESSVIELHREGVVERSNHRRLVIPFDRVIAFWEDTDVLMLRTKDDVLFCWQSTDLTPSDAAIVRRTILENIPDNTVFFKSPFYPLLTAPLPLPHITPDEEPAVTARGEGSVHGTFLQRFFRLFAEWGGVLLYICATIGCLIHDHLHFIPVNLSMRTLWTAVFAVLCAVLASVLLWLNTRRRKRQTPPLRVWNTTLGIKISTGMNEGMFPHGTYRQTFSRRWLTIKSGAETVRIPRAEAEILRNESINASISENSPY